MIQSGGWICSLLLFLSYTSQASSQDQLIVDREGNSVENYYFAVTGTLTLTCQITASAEGEHTLKWVDDSGTALVNSEATFDDDIDKIVLVLTKEHDDITADVVYRCIADDAADEAATVKIWKSEITESDDTFVVSGNEAEFSCKLDTGNTAITVSDVTVTWTKNGDTYTEGVETPVVEEGAITSTVRIASPTIESGDPYSCAFAITGSPASELESTVTLQVADELTITSDDTTLLIKGDEVTFTCECHASTEDVCTDLQWQDASNTKLPDQTESAWDPTNKLKRVTVDVQIADQSDTASKKCVVPAKAADLTENIDASQYSELKMQDSDRIYASVSQSNVAITCIIDGGDAPYPAISISKTDSTGTTTALTPTQSDNSATVTVTSAQAEDISYKCSLAIGDYNVASTVDTEKAVKYLGLESDEVQERIIGASVEESVTLTNPLSVQMKLYNDIATPPQITWDTEQMSMDVDGLFWISSVTEVEPADKVWQPVVTLSGNNVFEGFSLSAADRILKVLEIEVSATRILSGGSVAITCSISEKGDSTEYTITVEVGGITINSENSKKEGGKQIDVFSHTAEISQGYVCKVGTESSSQVDVTVDELSAVTSSLRIIEGSTQTTAKLTCAVTASQADSYTIEWYEPGSSDAMTTDDVISQSFASGTITSELDITGNPMEGEYKCKVQTLEQGIQVSIDVLSVTLGDKSFLWQDDTEIVCEISAEAANTYDLQWAYNQGGTPEAVSGTKVFGTDKIIYTARINNGNNAAGTYTCSVTDASVSVQITVYELVITSPATMTYYNAGTALTLSCQYTINPDGYTNPPTPTFSWNDADATTTAELAIAAPTANSEHTCTVGLGGKSKSRTTTLAERSIVLDPEAGKTYHTHRGQGGPITCKLHSEESVDDIIAKWSVNEVINEKIFEYDAAASFYTSTIVSPADEAAIDYICSTEAWSGMETGTLEIKTIELTTAPSTDFIFCTSGDVIFLEFGFTAPLDTATKIAVSGETAVDMTCPNNECTGTVSTTYNVANTANPLVVTMTTSKTGGGASKFFPDLDTLTLEKSYTLLERSVDGIASQYVLRNDDELQLNCSFVIEEEASDGSAVEVVWTRDDVDIMDGITGHPYSAEDHTLTSSLLVTSPQDEDFSEIKCMLKDDKPKTLSKTFGTPIINFVDNPTLTADSDEGYQEGAAIALTCTRSPSPTNSVKLKALKPDGSWVDVSSDWTKDTSVDTSVTFKKSSVLFSDEAKYKCTVTYTGSDNNDYVFSTAEVQISVEEYEQSTSYMDNTAETRIVVDFGEDLINSANGDVSWKDEAAGGETYESVAATKLLAGGISVEVSGSSTTLVVAPGKITADTSFLVTAKIDKDGTPKEHFKRVFVKSYAPSVQDVLWDSGAAIPDKARLLLPITSYDGIPAVSLSQGTYEVDVTNYNTELEVAVWPANDVTTPATVTVTVTFGNSETYSANLTFYKASIETVPQMDAESMKLLVLYTDDSSVGPECTFTADAGLDVTIAGSGFELDGEFVGEVASESELKLTHDQLTDPKEESLMYTCVYHVKFDGATHVYSRTFSVERAKGGKTNSGAIAAAVVIAILIIAIIIAFFIYRSRKNSSASSNQGSLPTKPVTTTLKTTELSTPSSPTAAPASPGQEAHPKFDEAVNFLDKIQARFQSQPDIYQTFLNTLTDFRAKEITKSDLVRKVGILFEGHPDLVEGFGNFLNSRKKQHRNGNARNNADVDLEQGGVVHMNRLAEDQA